MTAGLSPVTQRPAINRRRPRGTSRVPCKSGIDYGQSSISLQPGLSPRFVGCFSFYLMFTQISV
jgi:hypothetical protein